MKKRESCGIIYPTVRWNYMNNNLLTTTAMLSAFWEEENKDILDLLTPFVKYSLAQTTPVHSPIDILKLTEHFKSFFGYDTMPANTISLILNRLTPKIVRRRSKQLFLQVSLDKETQKFEKGHAEFEAHKEKVAEALATYLNDHLSIGTHYNQDTALSALIEFFATNGLCIISDVALLHMIKNKDDRLRYRIAQFVVEEAEKQSAIFAYIVDMVKGFFVSNVISLQSENPNVTEARFKDLNCYIDTKVIINALGMHDDTKRKSALEMLKMLRDQGANLYCFEHNYDEIDGIVEAYKNGLKYAYTTGYHPTLEGWDARNYTVADVERFQSVLTNKIASLGIAIASKPDETKDITAFPLDSREMKQYIDDNMTYNNKSAIDVDVASVSSILLMRPSRKTKEIEKCGCIFVTSNIHLTSISNRYLIQKGICDAEHEVMPIITDMDISSIVWLKCYSTHKDYPRKKLIEHSLIALEMTPTMMRTFFDMIDRIKAEGELTADEAAVIRADCLCRREIAQQIKGDITKLNEETVRFARDKLRSRYIGEVEETATLNLQKYQEERGKRRQMALNAVKKIKEVGDEVYDKKYPRYLFWFKCAIGLVWLLFVVTSVMSIQENSCLWIAAISLIFGIAGTMDMTMSKWNYLKKCASRWAHSKADIRMDEKREEYEKILGFSVQEEFV